MNTVQNVSAAITEDAAVRDALAECLIGLTGRDTVNINDGRAWFEIPLEVYLAHVDSPTLEDAIAAVRNHAWIVARAIGRLHRDEFPVVGLRHFSKELRHLVELPADGRGLRDLAESGLDDLAPKETQGTRAVDVGAPEAAGEPHRKFFDGGDVGQGLASVSEIHPEPLVPRRATPPP